MKKFLIISIALLFVAIVCAVVVFYTLVQINDTDSSGIVSPSTSESEAQEVLKVPAEGILVSDIPLSEENQVLLESIGVNTETMIITPEMAGCAEGRLGEERVLEILNGAAPGLLELGQLSTCLTP